MDIKDVKDLRNITLTKEEYVKLGKINKYLTSDDCEHLPLPPKKVMMQMWRHPTLGDVAYSDGFDLDLRMQSVSEKIGEPYEFLYPEEVK